MNKKVTSHIVKGIVISLILIVLSLLSYITGQQQEAWARWAQNLILFGGIIAACIIYANQMNNVVTFGNVFAHGFKVTAVITCIVIVFTVIFLLVSPDVKQQALQTARQEMIKNNTPDETVDKMLGITEKYFYPFTIGFILIAYLFIGVVASLLGAAFANKKDVDPFRQVNQTGEAQ